MADYHLTVLQVFALSKKGVNHNHFIIRKISRNITLIRKKFWPLERCLNRKTPATAQVWLGVNFHGQFHQVGRTLKAAFFF